MEPDEIWAKSHVYSAHGLRVLATFSGRFGVFENDGKFIAMARSAEEVGEYLKAAGARELVTKEESTPRAPRARPAIRITLELGGEDVVEF